MCHEEIHHCSRVDLADRDPVAHRDCKRSSRVPVEPRVREQRLLTISGASERFCSRLKNLGIRRAAGLYSRVGHPFPARSVSPMRRFCSPRCLLLGSSMRLDVRMSARGVKAKQAGLKLVGRG